MDCALICSAQMNKWAPFILFLTGPSISILRVIWVSQSFLKEEKNLIKTVGCHRGATLIMV